MSLIYPDKCKFCGKAVLPNNLICSDCANDLSVIGDNICLSCGVDKEFCSCKIGDFAFERSVSYFYYEGAAKIALTRFKFHNLPQLSPVLAKYISSKVSDKYKGFTIDCVTYVPSNRIKMLIRGYNTAQLLANDVAKLQNLPVQQLLTSKFTLLSQKYKKRKERRASVKGKFEFNFNNVNVKDKTILLVDDVMTTGSTLSECAKILKKAGAKRVLCATFAITLKK